MVTPETCTVLFTEEKGHRSRLYDFTKLPVAADVQRWMARCFARATGPRGGAKRLNTANSYYMLFAHLSRVLASAQHPPATVGQIAPAHIAAFRLSLTPASLNNSIHRLRTLVRHDDELPAGTRRCICAGRLPRRPVAKILAYTEQERQQILGAARADIRKARDRIHGARELLDRYRRGEAARLDQRERRTAQALDVLDRTGDLPRHDCGAIPDWAQDVGGAHGLLPMLCLTRMEAAAFAVLLVDMTGENFGTIIDWPAAHFRPDGGLGDQAVALVEETKPRRGPNREHMVAALEDLPGEVAGVLADDGESRLFRSPLRAYSLLLDLTSLARRRGGFDVAFAYVAISGAAKWRAGMNSFYVGRWAEDHGFPQPPPSRPDRPGMPRSAPADTAKPPVLLLRLRQTAIERGRRPIAHSRDTIERPLPAPQPSGSEGEPGHSPGGAERRDRQGPQRPGHPGLHPGLPGPARHRPGGRRGRDGRGRHDAEADRRPRAGHRPGLLHRSPRQPAQRAGRPVRRLLPGLPGLPECPRPAASAPGPGRRPRPPQDAAGRPVPSGLGGRAPPTRSPRAPSATAAPRRQPASAPSSTATRRPGPLPALLQEPPDGRPAT